MWTWPNNNIYACFVQYVKKLYNIIILRQEQNKIEKFATLPSSERVSEQTIIDLPLQRSNTEQKIEGFP